MPQKTKIAILGIGAVGGYLGGLLSEKYFQSGEVEIIFIAREKTVQIIREKGLKIITPDFEKIVFPSLVTSDPNDIEHIDYLICCVKSYDLKESLLPFKKCISSATIILPLLNGVDAKERIAHLFPQAQIWDGCVYIISRLIEPGVIKEAGNVHSFYFGSGTSSEKKLKEFETILKEAGVECHLSANIEQTIWEKFLFISVVASLTSYLDLPIGPILADSEHRKLVGKLLTELKTIADGKGILLPEDIIEKTISKMERMPFETTSSMHSDFQKGGKTEYHSLTEYVVNEGKRLNIETPEYDTVLKELRKK